MLDQAVNAAESTGARVEKLVLSHFTVGPCLERGDCRETGECSIDDDFKLFYRKIMAVDRLIIAAPVYFMGFPAQAKALIDRCQAFYARKYVLKKRIPDRGAIKRRGFLLSAAGFESEEAFDCLRKTMKYLCLTIDMEFSGDVVVPGVDAKGEIEDHPDALKRSWELGLRATAPQ